MLKFIRLQYSDDGKFLKYKFANIQHFTISLAKIINNFQ